MEIGTQKCKISDTANSLAVKPGEHQTLRILTRVQLTKDVSRGLGLYSIFGNSLMVQLNMKEVIISQLPLSFQLRT